MNERWMRQDWLENYGACTKAISEEMQMKKPFEICLIVRIYRTWSLSGWVGVGNDVWMIP